ncbi:hypothetical protein HMPREF9371_2249 [Neisseria shayeganii 871]|uniref:Uncharacterized protein n=1 Tax=Neisseria shayeganii 871 TaxID=1032488 RepID=G4CKV8_9NEIS|nr:hypothetical protein HMPREF9371_2249 [Neisseria shayeganii 871]
MRTLEIRVEQTEQTKLSKRVNTSERQQNINANAAMRRSWPLAKVSAFYLAL